MTKKQSKLIRRCIYAARKALEVKENPQEYQGHWWEDFELVEVAGKFNGVDKRTAESLVEAGILVTDMPTWTSEFTNTHVRLPRLNEMEEYHARQSHS